MPQEFDQNDVRAALEQVQLTSASRVVIRYDGHIDAGGGDNKILVRLNGSRSGYRSFVVMNGDCGAGEWDKSGIYVGRNGWGRDADFSFSMTVSLMLGRKRVSNVISSFAHTDRRILGYTGQGFWEDTASPVERITVWSTGPGSLVRNSAKIIFED